MSILSTSMVVCNSTLMSVAFGESGKEASLDGVSVQSSLALFMPILQTDGFLQFLITLSILQ